MRVIPLTSLLSHKGRGSPNPDDTLSVGNGIFNAVPNAQGVFMTVIGSSNANGLPQEGQTFETLPNREPPHYNRRSIGLRNGGKSLFKTTKIEHVAVNANDMEATLRLRSMNWMEIPTRCPCWASFPVGLNRPVGSAALRGCLKSLAHSPR